MNLKEQALQLKTDIAKIINAKNCFFCKCKICKKGVTIHHRWYIPNDVVRKNYPKNDSGTVQYYKDLLPLVKRNPKRFRFVCNKCHQAYERIKRYSQKTLTKFRREVKSSEKDRIRYASKEA